MGVGLGVGSGQGAVPHPQKIVHLGEGDEEVEGGIWPTTSMTLKQFRCVGT